MGLGMSELRGGHEAPRERFFPDYPQPRRVHQQSVPISTTPVSPRLIPVSFTTLPWMGTTR